MILQALASGSNGNAFIINDGETSILIDAGISRKRIIKGILDLNISLESLRYVLITHAHTDHVGGLAVLNDHLTFEVVATEGTIQEIKKLQRIDPRFAKVANNAFSIEDEGTVEINGIVIESYRALHDIAGAVGFSVIFENGIRVSYTTDNQHITTQFQKAMRQSDFIILESNHNRILLDNSRRPPYLKERIKKTHLSNKQMAGILNGVITERTKCVFLAHLSGECNSPGHVCDVMISLKNHFDRSPKKPSEWRWVVCTREESSSLVTYDGILTLEGGLNDSNPVEPDLVSQKISREEYILKRIPSNKSKQAKHKDLTDFFE